MINFDIDKNLASNRELIDDLDRQIFEILKKRFDIVKEIGRIKRENNLHIFDKKRESEIISKKVIESGMKKDFVEKLFTVIFEESRKLQE